MIKCNKLKLLALGPLPPPLGGTTVLFEDFVRRIQTRIGSLTVIDMNDRRAGFRFFSFLSALISFFWRAPGHDVVTLHASVKRLIWLGAFLRLSAFFHRKPVVLRAFGGALDLQYEQAGVVARIAFKMAFSNELVLLETKHLIDYFKERFPSSNIQWLPNSRSQVDSLRSSENRNGKFIFVGHVNDAKGVGTIIDMLKSSPKEGIFVDIAGPLSAGFLPDRLDGVLGLNYLGVIPSESVSKLIGEYEALVLPTSYKGEGYPGVILEAYAQATPVITTNWRSVPEIVSDSHTGILVPPNNPSALKDAMKKFLSDRSAWVDMSRNASFYVKRFDPDVWHGSRWDEWLVSVLKKN